MTLSQIEKEMAKSYKRLPSDAASAQAEYERLQRELELEKLKTKALETMIDIAESDLKVPIRKKSGAKQ